MDLQPFQGEGSMAQGPDFFAGSRCADFEDFRQIVMGYHQRVVAGQFEGAWQALKNAPAVMHEWASATVDKFPSRGQVPTECRGHGLHAEAYPKDRTVPWHFPHHSFGAASIGGFTRAGAHQNAPRAPLEHPIQVDFGRSLHLDLGPKGTQRVFKVEGEGVSIVQEEDHGSRRGTVDKLGLG